jgi:hypothetical protein
VVKADGTLWELDTVDKPVLVAELVFSEVVDVCKEDLVPPEVVNAWTKDRLTIVRKIIAISSVGE